MLKATLRQAAIGSYLMSVTFIKYSNNTL